MVRNERFTLSNGLFISKFIMNNFYRNILFSARVTVHFINEVRGEDDTDTGRRRCFTFFFGTDPVSLPSPLPYFWLSFSSPLPLTKTQSNMSKCLQRYVNMYFLTTYLTLQGGWCFDKDINECIYRVMPPNGSK